MCDKLIEMSLLVSELHVGIYVRLGKGSEVKSRCVDGGGEGGAVERGGRYSCNTVPALLPCPEFGFVEGVVFGADDDEVERHCEWEVGWGCELCFVVVSSVKSWHFMRQGLISLAPTVSHHASRLSTRTIRISHKIMQITITGSKRLSPHIKVKLDWLG